MHRLWFVRLLLSAALAGVSGCASSPDDRDDGLEHQVPAHKPSTFAAALQELERRRTALIGKGKPGWQDKTGELSELRDIIGWLPELAADTDLGKSDWETVQRASAELMQLVERDSTAAFAPPDFDSQAFQRLLETLRSLPVGPDTNLVLDRTDQKRGEDEHIQSSATILKGVR